MQKCIWYSPSSFCFDGETPSFLIRFTTKNRKFRASKKPTVGFFALGLRQRLSPGQYSLRSLASQLFKLNIKEGIIRCKKFMNHAAFFHIRIVLLQSFP